MTVTVITCTGARWELFALCKRWVERQTVKPDLWLVATDTGEVPTDLPSYAKHIAVPRCPDNIKHLPASGPSWALHYTLGHVPHPSDVVIMEDDDWYARTHVQVATLMLRDHEVVQLEKQWRFHLPTQKVSRGHPGHPTQSLFVPGVASLRSSAIERVRGVLFTEPFGRTPLHSYDAVTCVSIKGAGYGLPGRTGATTKHRPDHRKNVRAPVDKGWKQLRALIGEEDTNAYIGLLR